MNDQAYVPHLPVFKAIQKAIGYKAPFLENTAFICTQHELATTINLFETLIDLGAIPENIYLMGKYYSSCEAVVKKLIELGIKRQPHSIPSKVGDFANTFKTDLKKMWEKFSADSIHSFIKRIIILDDGGRCLSTAPSFLHSKYPIIGIEQTTGGLNNPEIVNLPFGLIEVASSAAKLWLESPLIANAAITEPLNKILQSNNKDNVIYGVIGTGYIGMAIIKKLLSLGYEVIGYDKNQTRACEFNRFKWGKNVEDVINKATYIFGCTGFDITDSMDFDSIINEDKVFISCASEDREFLTLLKLTQAQSPEKYKLHELKSVFYQTKKGFTIEILRSGFPITFNGHPQPAPAVDIQLTQGLLLCALLQANFMLPLHAEENKKERIMLDPAVQSFICHSWAKTQPKGRYAEDLLKRFDDQQWVLEHSGGKYYKNIYLTKYFLEKENFNESIIAE